jgi:hypothetical protein
MRNLGTCRGSFEFQIPGLRGFFLPDKPVFVPFGTNAHDTALMSLFLLTHAGIFPPGSARVHLKEIEMLAHLAEKFAMHGEISSCSILKGGRHRKWLSTRHRKANPVHERIVRAVLASVKAREDDFRWKQKLRSLRLEQTKATKENRLPEIPYWDSDLFRSLFPDRAFRETDPIPFD